MSNTVVFAKTIRDYGFLVLMIIFTIFRTLGWIEVQWERQRVKANSEKIQPEWVEKLQSQEKKSWNRISPNRYSLVLFKHHFGNKAFSDTLRKILESIQLWWWLRKTKKKIHFFSKLTNISRVEMLQLSTFDKKMCFSDNFAATHVQRHKYTNTFLIMHQKEQDVR